MAHAFMKKLKSLATGKQVVLLLIPTWAVYLTMLLVTIPKVQFFASGMEIFDLSLMGYSYEYAIRLLINLGVEGRYVYLHQQLPLDFIYPGLFALSSCLLMAWVFSKTQTPAWMYYCCWLPIAAAVFDYAENIQIMMMILQFPTISEHQVQLASLATMAKSGLTAVFYVVLIAALIRLSITFLNGKAK